MLTAGAYMLAGVRADLLTGGSLAEKLKHMATDDGMKAFMERATKGKDGEGFWLIHGEVGTLVIVPAGYIIVNAGVTSASDAGTSDREEGATGLRWGYLDSCNSTMLKQTQTICAEMLKTFAELGTSPYKSWGETLEKFLLPAIA